MKQAAGQKQHTPTPYYFDVQENQICIFRRWDDWVKPGNTNTFGEARGALICRIDYNDGVPSREQAEANAAFIVRAVNAHDALLHVARLASRKGQHLRDLECANVGENCDPKHCVACIAEAAIAKAEGR